MFCVIGLFFPALRLPLIFIGKLFWMVIKTFFLADAIKTVLIYLVLAVLFAGVMGYIGHKTENYLWTLSALVVDVLGLFAIFI